MCVSFGHQLGHYQLWRSVIYSMWEWRAPTSNMVDIGQATCWTSPDQQTSPNTSQHDTPVPPPPPPWWLKTFPGLTLSWVACHCIWKALRGRETVTRVVVVGVAGSVCVCVCVSHCCGCCCHSASRASGATNKAISTTGALSEPVQG